MNISLGLYNVQRSFKNVNLIHKIRKNVNAHMFYRNVSGNTSEGSACLLCLFVYIKIDLSLDFAFVCTLLSMLQ